MLGMLSSGAYREMSLIEKQTATVYYAPTKRRRYFSLQAAIHAEAVARIYRKHPAEATAYVDDVFYPGWDIKYDDPDRFGTMLRRMKRIIKAAHTLNKGVEK